MGLLEVGNIDEGNEIMTYIDTFEGGPITDRILHHEDVHDSPIDQFIAYHMRKNGFGVPPSPGEPDSFSKKTLKARVDDGRWLVDCPNCNSALVISGQFDIFICAECGSPENNGLWYFTEYPKDREEIERLLLLRPAGMGRGFVEGSNVPVGGPRFFSEDDVNHQAGDTTHRIMPGQTVKDIRAENEELGCGV